MGRGDLVVAVGGGVVGDPTADETGALLQQLDRTCRTVRLLGVYTK